MSARRLRASVVISRKAPTTTGRAAEMSAYIDPLTAITLAHDARADRIRRVAEHRRILEATRVTGPETHVVRRIGTHRVVHRMLAAVRRHPAPA